MEFSVSSEVKIVSLCARHIEHKVGDLAARTSNYSRPKKLSSKPLKRPIPFRIYPFRFSTHRILPVLLAVICFLIFSKNVSNLSQTS